MKIRYISNFTDGTDWSQSAIYNVLALDNAGYDVYCGEIKYSKSNVILDDKIIPLFQKSTEENCEVTIHHVLPDQYIKHRDTINIGFYPVDSTISNIVVRKKISLMDKMFVPSYESKVIFEKLGMNIPVEVFKNSLDYERVSTFKSKEPTMALQNGFNFLFLNEFAKQKNLEDCLRAYYTEFNRFDPINMVIASEKDPESVKSFTAEVKARLKKPERYKEELIYSGNIMQDHRLTLLDQVHALVVSSYAEASSYTAMEAMVMGLPIIYTNGIGVGSYLQEEDHFPVRSSVETCYGATQSLPEMYTCNDKWLKVEVQDLQRAMREVVNLYWMEKEKYVEKTRKISEYAKSFDYRNKNLVKDII